MIALMGPSGSGKTTLLNVLARRPAAASASVKGQVHLDNAPLQAKTLREISTYVEQEDALIGIACPPPPADGCAALTRYPYRKLDRPRNHRIRRPPLRSQKPCRPSIGIDHSIRVGEAGEYKDRHPGC